MWCLNRLTAQYNEQGDCRVLQVGFAAWRVGLLCGCKGVINHIRGVHLAAACYSSMFFHVKFSGSINKQGCTCACCPCGHEQRLPPRKRVLQTFCRSTSTTDDHCWALVSNQACSTPLLSSAHPYLVLLLWLDCRRLLGAGSQLSKDDSEHINCILAALPSLDDHLLVPCGGRLAQECKHSMQGMSLS